MLISGLDRSLPSPYSAPSRVQQNAYLSHERLDISYQDAAGGSFSLSIQTDVLYSSVTYDRGGRMDNRTGSLTKDLEEALRDARGAVHGFKHLLHRLAKALGAGETDSPSAASPSGSSLGVVATSETVTIQMNDVDPDYWSVEKTAGRLADFAVALYRGGDRGAHAQQMEKAMEEGYRQAARAFGGTLPDIARQTVEAAKRLLADWVKGAQSEAVVSPAHQLDLAA